jgi:hypothetical protein
MVTLVNKTKRAVYVNTYKIPALGQITLSTEQVTPGIRLEIKNLVSMHIIDAFTTPDVEENVVEEQPVEETKTTKRKSTKKKVEETTEEVAEEQTQEVEE